MFVSREEAGQKLGGRLKELGVQAELVVGLPRGGVVVAAAVARVMQLPLGVLVVRKVGHPMNREFAVGALAENGVVILDEGVIGGNPVIRAELDQVVAEEQKRLQSYQAKFHGVASHDLAGKAVLIVDDGFATGATAEAAVLSARKQNARRIVVAVPVASTSAMIRLGRAADQVIALCEDPEFDAVGRYYEVFSQTTDDEVLDLLGRA